VLTPKLPCSLSSSSMQHVRAGSTHFWQLLLSIYTRRKQYLGAILRPHFTSIVTSMLSCKRRRVQGGEDQDLLEPDASVPPCGSHSHPPEKLNPGVVGGLSFGALPDFAIWPAAGHLASKDLGHLAIVSKSISASVFHEAFLPKLLQDRGEAFGIPERMTKLAQLHLAEEVAKRQRLRIVFGMMCDEVPLEAEEGLQSLVALAQMHPKAVVEVEGHTSAGPLQLAERISRGRAEAVAEVLQSFGLAEQQLEVSWFRDERLLPEYDDDIHPEHRRAEVFLSLDDIRLRV